MTADPSAAPLEVEHLFKHFHNSAVLEDVHLTIAPGECFGLVGLNGIGKTTFIKIILGLLSHDPHPKTKIHFLGKPIHHMKTRQQVSFLPEKFQPSPYLKGHEFLRLTLAYYDKQYDTPKAAKQAEALGLNPDALSKKISSYSKGMCQKLGLIGVLLTNTPLLILDEPMSGLDPSARIYLKEALLAYVAKGNTLFFSSHILSDIEEICSTIGVLHDRRLLFTGTPKAFKSQHKHDQLERAFLRAIGLEESRKAA